METEKTLKGRFLVCDTLKQKKTHSYILAETIIRFLLLVLFSFSFNSFSILFFQNYRLPKRHEYNEKKVFRIDQKMIRVFNAFLQ